MKKQLIALAVLSLFAAGAQAQTAVAGAAQQQTATGTATSFGSHQGQEQGQHQSADSNSTSLSSAKGINANQQGVTFNSPGTVDYSGTYTVKSAVPLAIGGPASGPCNGFSAGLGVTVPGFGIVGNMSKVDEGCEERETARIAALMGRMDIANTIIEQTDVYQRALKRKEEKAAAAKQQPAKKAEADGYMKQTSYNAGGFTQASYTAPTPTEQQVNQCNFAKSTGDQFLAMRVCK